MKYSIIITYRDREKHLSQLLPVLQKKFYNHFYEIIIAEQDDDKKFRKNDLYNIAVRDYATGDVLIFHDVDYVPDEKAEYIINDQPVYPCRRAIFLDKDNKLKPIEDIPKGYQLFYRDTGNHSGGVFILTKEMWEEIGGLNPLYVGWGLEDDDTRERLQYHKYSWYRNEHSVGTFHVLDHDDNHPGVEDKDFQKNIDIAKGFRENIGYGYQDSKGIVKKFDTDIENLIWLKIKEDTSDE